ncbi:MAG: HAD-IC family P-type ATPase, partial [bacterium]|nr:HAD-IC family P-type ATPase [bacterium]
MKAPYDGLNQKQVQELRLEYGANVLPTEKPRPVLKILFSQITNPLIGVIFIVGMISLWRREYRDVVIILLVVVLNTIMGFFQEYKAQKALFALKEMIKPMARVLRNREKIEIEAADLVPGDIIFLEAGDKIPADSRILEEVSFFVDEAILTGESEAIEKKEKDRVFMGTIVISGRAIAVAENIGVKTKVGQIAQTLKETIQPVTILQQRLAKFSYFLTYLILTIAILIVFLELLAGQDFWQALRVAMVIAIAVIPEALPLTVTLILAVGMRKILKRKALVRKLLAVETLGSVTTICTDKTGTLTEGKMIVAKAGLKDDLKSYLAMALCNNLADPLEMAIWNYLKKQEGFSPEKISGNHQRVLEIPFSGDHKFMATVNLFPDEAGTEHFLFAKGAPEIILEMSALGEEERQKNLEIIEGWSRQGYKVLGLAFQKISDSDWSGISVKTMPKLEWAGIIGLWDPPRKEAKEALMLAQKAGIEVKVVTGDHRYTAEKIMSFFGMPVSHTQVLEGRELEEMNDQELKDLIKDVLLFARVTPRQKLRIVSILQELGEVVAMTGDGVNDAPALKKSNIGIVVGSASDVAREIADLVLLDSNFRTIVAAVEEGRVVFENVKKAVFFMLSNSFAEVFLILGTILLRWPMPLTIIQILWLHFLCDGPEDIVLAFEKK